MADQVTVKTTFMRGNGDQKTYVETVGVDQYWAYTCSAKIQQRVDAQKDDPEGFQSLVDATCEPGFALIDP